MKKFHPHTKFWCGGKKILLIFLSIFLIAIAISVVAQDEIPPTVSVEALPPEVITIWQNTEAVAYVSCSNEESGCDGQSYKLKIYDTVTGTCSVNYDEYSFCNGFSCTDENPQTISSHQWVCGAAKDLAGNIGFSGPLEFKVDITFPTGTIEVIPNEVRADEIFNIIVSGEDNIDMGVVCYKEENDIDWACYSCVDGSTSCSYSFEKSKSALRKYKYYGYVADFVENGNYTDPDYVFVIVETNPSVATFSVTYQATQATLNGYLTGMGGADLVEVWFEWGETTAYGNETGHVPKNTTGIFSSTITGLSPKTVYHFRAVAENGAAIAFGEDMVTTELIKNGGFETGDLTGWEEVKKGGRREASTDDIHKGLYSGLIGFKAGRNSRRGKSGIYQDLTIPSTAANIELSLWYKFYTTDRCDYDFINIYLKDTSNNILKTYLEWCYPGALGELQTYGWNQITDDLTDFAGQTVRIYFEVENRSDWWHRSWAYIDEVSIKYIPTSLPSVTTKPATGVETGEAVLNGELTDMGEADLVEVWFVWDVISHERWQDYPNETDHILETSVGPFSAFVGNLSPGTIYHFRAVAKSTAGTSYGDDLKFTTEYSTAGGWISPSGHEDPEGKWVDEPKAYDAPYAPNYLETYASNSLSETACSPIGLEYGGFIVFTLPYEVRSNKIRVNADYLDIHINYVDIDVLREGSWINVHSGPIANCAWEEIPFSEGLVTKARFRYNYKVSDWCYWVYEFQFYQVPDEPITPPAGNTLEATSIEENTAILHGQVIDDGRELCQIRFQYGKTAAYGINTGWEGSWASGDTSGKFISGLEEGVTYHFRAQIKNSAGIASGADKTFFTQSAVSGWVSPQGFNDPDGKWENEGCAYDDEIGTYAKSYRYPGDGVWTPYLYLTRQEISSEKIRFWARELVEVDLIVIDVYRDGSWINVYNGTFPDYQWVEASFTSGKVTQARVQFHSRYVDNYFYYHLYEFDFWKIAEKPSVITVTTEAAEVGLDQAKVKGKLTDLGGAHSVDVWFIWDTNYYDNWEDYASSSATNKETMVQTGEFEYTIGGLTSATTYHFRAIASSGAGTSSGDDKTFTTLGECVTGATTTCTSEEGCDHIIECPEEGYWPPCPRDKCVRNATSTPDCPCPSPPPGYASPEYGNCRDDCTCNTSTDPGPCEPWLANQPPSAINLSQTEGGYCGFLQPPIYLSWEFFDPDPGDEQTAYQVQVDDNSDFSSLEANSGKVTGISGKSTTSAPILSFSKEYYWRVKVWDSQNIVSDCGDAEGWCYPSPNFFNTKPIHPEPDFEWFPEKPAQGEVVQFCSVYEEVEVCEMVGEEEVCHTEIICPEDKSTCYNVNNDPISCLGGTFTWTMPGAAGIDYEFVGGSNENPRVKFLTTTGGDITLEITDKDGYGPCSKTYSVGIRFPLPEWKEIAPF